MSGFCYTLHLMNKGFGFKVVNELGGGTLARTGIVRTPHGAIKTPAFIVVGTAATVKAMTPEQVRGAGAQAVLANAYHLYLTTRPQGGGGGRRIRRFYELVRAYFYRQRRVPGALAWFRI